MAAGGDVRVIENRSEEGRLLKMGPRVKERVALLSVSPKFTLLFTLPDEPLFQEQRGHTAEQNEYVTYLAVFGEGTRAEA